LLVTGWDKASSWANAVFSDGSSDFRIDIGFGQPCAVEGKLSVKVEWVSPGTRFIEKNWGPPRYVTVDQCDIVHLKSLKWSDRFRRTKRPMRFRERLQNVGQGYLASEKAIQEKETATKGDSFPPLVSPQEAQR